MNTTPTTEQRLARLETNARRWKLAAVGLAGLVVGGVAVGFGQPTKYFDRDQLTPMEEEILINYELFGAASPPRVVGVVSWSNTSDGGSRMLSRFWSDGSVDAAKGTSWSFRNDSQGIRYEMNGVDGNFVPVVFDQ